MIPSELLAHSIALNVQQALLEDIGERDITALLIPETEQAQARIMTREPMILAGQPWVDALFNALDPRVQVTWLHAEGAHLHANETFLTLSGPARSLLTGERAALNFLQTLSATATRVAAHVQLLEGLHTRLLDTRKTLPCLRMAQKYAVTVGGGQNHRLGLFDAFLIKENHIMAAGGIAHAIAAARQIAADKPVEVIVMLDNFSSADMTRAVEHVAGRCLLEASGNITQANLREVALTGVDYISMGTLTKDLLSIDLSMRFV
jgi:nicotinate-nucleotide pyrophosphorylase (carboxylating)